MERLPVKMTRPNLKAIPNDPLPENYRINFFKPGDAIHWARIEWQAGEFPDEKTALERFKKEFGSHEYDMTKRCLFIETADGQKIGTTTAWCGRLNDKSDITGRIHWVGITPDHQGKKLAKPLLSHALKVLAKYHNKAYLTSQTTSYQAINMYLNYGFQPLIENEEDTTAWTLLEKVLKRKII